MDVQIEVSKIKIATKIERLIFSYVVDRFRQTDLTPPQSDHLVLRGERT